MLLKSNPSQVLNPLAFIQVKSQSGLKWGPGGQGDLGYLNEFQERIAVVWAPCSDAAWSPRYQECLTGQRPLSRPGPTGDITSHCWLGKVWGTQRSSWNLWLGIKMSELTFSACCDPKQEQQKKMNE